MLYSEQIAHRKDAYKILIQKPEGKLLSGGPRNRLSNIKMDNKKCDVVGWIIFAARSSGNVM